MSNAVELLNMSDDDLEYALDHMKAGDFRTMMRLALKEQDRDTRHACADTVNAVISASRTAASVPAAYTFICDRLHQAVMNVKATGGTDQ